MGNVIIGKFIPSEINNVQKSSISSGRIIGTITPYDEKIRSEYLKKIEEEKTIEKKNKELEELYNSTVEKIKNMTFEEYKQFYPTIPEEIRENFKNPSIIESEIQAKKMENAKETIEELNRLIKEYQEKKDYWDREINRRSDREAVDYAAMKRIEMDYYISELEAAKQYAATGEYDKNELIKTAQWRAIEKYQLIEEKHEYYKLQKEKESKLIKEYEKKGYVPIYKYPNTQLQELIGFVPSSTSKEEIKEITKSFYSPIISYNQSQIKTSVIPQTTLTPQIQSGEIPKKSMSASEVFGIQPNPLVQKLQEQEKLNQNILNFQQSTEPDLIGYSKKILYFPSEVLETAASYISKKITPPAKKQQITFSDVPPYKLRGSISPSEGFTSLIPKEEAEKIKQFKARISESSMKSAIETLAYSSPLSPILFLSSGVKSYAEGETTPERLSGLGTAFLGTLLTRSQLKSFSEFQKIKEFEKAPVISKVERYDLGKVGMDIKKSFKDLRDYVLISKSEQPFIKVNDKKIVQQEGFGTVFKIDYSEPEKIKFITFESGGVSYSIKTKPKISYITKDSSLRISKEIEGQASAGRGYIKKTSEGEIKIIKQPFQLNKKYDVMINFEPIPTTEQEKIYKNIVGITKKIKDNAYIFTSGSPTKINKIDLRTIRAIPEEIGYLKVNKLRKNFGRDYYISGGATKITPFKKILKDQTIISNPSKEFEYFKPKPSVKTENILEKSEIILPKTINRQKFEPIINKNEMIPQPQTEKTISIEFVPEIKQKIIPKSNFIPIEKLKNLQKEMIKQQSVTKDIQKGKKIIKQFSPIISKENLKYIQIIKPKLKTPYIEIVKQKPTIPKIPPTTNIEKPTIPKIPPTTILKSKKPEINNKKSLIPLLKSYDVLIRSKGKIKTIAKGVPYGKGLKIGVSKVKSSLAQTFALKESKTLIRDYDVAFRVPEQLFTTPKLSKTIITPQTFVERRGKTLTEKAEIGELQKAKRKKLLIKNGYE